VRQASRVSVSVVLLYESVCGREREVSGLSRERDRQIQDLIARVRAPWTLPAVVHTSEFTTPRTHAVTHVRHRKVSSHLLTNVDKC
jgi:hypothetical protein